MTNRKKNSLTLNIFFTLMTLALVSEPSYSMNGEDDRPCEQSRDPHQMMDALSITDNQKEAFLKIMKAQHEKRQSIHEQYQPIHEQEHDAMRALHQEALSELSTVLSEDQLKKFDSFIKENRAGRDRRNTEK